MVPDPLARHLAADTSATGTPLSPVASLSPVVSPPITGSDARFPVRRVYSIGRNYAVHAIDIDATDLDAIDIHAIEMGHDPDRDPPFFLQKNPNNLTKEVPSVIRQSRVMCTVGNGDVMECHVLGAGDLTVTDLWIPTSTPRWLLRPWALRVHDSAVSVGNRSFAALIRLVPCGLTLTALQQSLGLRRVTREGQNIPRFGTP